MQQYFCNTCGRKIDECVCGVQERNERPAVPQLRRRQQVADSVVPPDNTGYAQTDAHHAPNLRFTLDGYGAINGRNTPGCQPYPDQRAIESEPVPPAAAHERVQRYNATPARPISGLEHNPRRMVSDIVMGEGEIPIRRYRIGSVPKWFSIGGAEVLITNRRLIYHSTSRILLLSGRNLQEVSLESINGVNHYYGKGLKRSIAIVAGILAALFLLSLLIPRYLLQTLPPFWPLLLVSAALFVLARRPSYALQINASNSDSTMGASVNMESVYHGKNGQGVVFGFYPTHEAITMMNEIGACLMDIKTRGDYAIKTWSNI